MSKCFYMTSTLTSLAAAAALLRFDGTVVAAEQRTVLIRKRDALTVVVALPLLLAFARAWLADLPAERAQIVTLTLASLTSMVLVTGALARLREHQSHGPIAFVALQPGVGPWFLSAILMGGHLVMASAATVVGVASVAEWTIGAIAGLVLAAAVVAVRTIIAERMRREPSFAAQVSLSLRSASRVVSAGAFALGLGLAGAAQLGWLDAPTIQGMSGVIALTVALIMGWVDHDQARFQLMIGHTPLTIIAQTVLPCLTAGFAFAVSLSLGLNWIAAAIAAGASLACVLFITLAVLTHCVFSRRLAEWALTLLIGVVAMTAFAAPPLAPLVLLGAAIWLLRRAHDRRWIIA
jgi:hypothetical protein